jgi:predicted phage-related endonuclease
MTSDDRQAFLQARCGSVGSSDMPNIIRRTKAGYSASRANLMALKVLERLTGLPAETYQSAAMTAGVEREPLARAAYGFMQDVTVELVPAPGVVPHPLIEGAHASPDGTIGMLGLVEIKCPQPAAHLDTLLNEKIDNDYFVQMQWQMAVTGRHWADYVSWSPDFPPSMQLWSERVERAPEVIDELEREARLFLKELEAKVAELRKRYELKEAA